MDPNSELFDDTNDDKRLRKMVDAVDAFVALVLQKCLNLLSNDTNTARDGAKYVTYKTNGKYNIYHNDWVTFAKLFSDQLKDTDLRTHCAMSCVRFYTCAHGIKMTREAGAGYLEGIIDVDHDYVDIVQIHHASNLSWRNDSNEALLVRLDCLAHLFKNSVRLQARSVQFQVSGEIRPFLLSSSAANYIAG